VAEMPAEPAAGEAAVAAAACARARRRRLAAAVLGGALGVLALLILGRELIAARVPQHRAALEELVRHETGLEVSFSRLSVRWGWYGPEAVFHEVTLAEPRAALVLRAPQLIVALDTWRSVRSGHFEAGRITLVAPDIDLSPRAASTAFAPAAAAAGAQALGEAPRLLARWRGGRIDIEGGTLRWLGQPGAPVVVNLARADLRRLGADWSADVQLLLPDSLGAGAQLALRLSGDLADPASVSGSVTFSGERLVFAGWRALGVLPALERYLPRAGTGNLDVHARLTAGAAALIAGSVRAQALEWAPGDAGARALVLPRLRADWQLTRVGSEWRIAVGSLDVGTGTSAGAAALVLGPEAVHGNLRAIPVPLLAALAQHFAPALPLEQLVLEGEARAADFDWDPRRPAGARLMAEAELRELTLTDPARGVRLGGLTARLSIADGRLAAQLSGRAAHLTLEREQPFALTDLELRARLEGSTGAAQWQLRTEDLEVRHAGAHLSARAALSELGGVRRLDAQLHLKDADALLIARLAGPEALAALGPAAARLTGGRIERADLELHPQLNSGEPLTASRGSFELRAAAFAGSESWPEVEGLAARISWVGPKVRADITAARSGGLALTQGQASWDARGEQALRASGRLAGSAAVALEWLRARPQLAAYAPGAGFLDLDGNTRLDVDLVVPGTAAHQPPARTRITAVLDGVGLHALAGLPPIEGLRGRLAFADGTLQRASLSGQWLGGPLTLGIAAQRAGTADGLSVSGKGVIEARQALAAAGAEDSDLIAGSAEWSAQLTLSPQADTQPLKWHLRADSPLTLVASHLPEPLAKAAGSAVPLHLEVTGAGLAAQLQFAVGERAAAAAALERSGERWRISRGALRLGAGSAPALPGAPLIALDGHVRSFDLPAFLALWQQAGRAATLPALEAHVTASEMQAGTRVIRDVSLAAQSTPRGGELELQSDELSAQLRWGAAGDAAHPAQLHAALLEVPREGDAALAVGLAQLLGPTVQFSVDELRWQGRPVGRLTAQLTAHGGAVSVTDLLLAGSAQEVRAFGQCPAGEAPCSARFSVHSNDLAATLDAFGLRPDLEASAAAVTGELEWPQGAGATLASLTGHLHMQVDEGTVRAGEAPESAPFALFIVPALISALSPEGPDAPPPPPLHFGRLSADFELRGGAARTANLHLDGDAEILVHASVGLAARDYDAQAVILRGEERLPSALRRLGPTPKVAALWLSLREWFTGAPQSARAALRLRGTWNDPIVMAAE